VHSLVSQPAQAPQLSAKQRLLLLLSTRLARIGVIGLGYVGLPLALEFARGGFSTIGFDVDAERIDAINQSRSYLPGLENHEIEEQRLNRRLHATADIGRLSECDCIIICVPTPLSKTNDPDVSHILAVAREIKTHLRTGQLIVLESTTYPGSTDELILPLLRETRFELDDDFLLAFSPERIDPGNAEFMTNNIPKIVGGCSPASTEVAAAMYAQIVSKVHAVSSARVAETAKLLENTFRAVNIGLVNEMARLCHELKIDIWEVIDAAKTKPFGYMPFYPGPGLGGHCIPLDPQYLSWKGRQFGFDARFIGLAHEINSKMPHHVIRLIADGLNEHGLPLNRAKVMVLGVAYKKNVNDARESPASDVIQLLREQKAHVSYHDPYVPTLRFDTMHAKESRASVFKGPERRSPDNGAASGLTRRRFDTLHSVELDPHVLTGCDCVVIVTDHACVDYRSVVEYAPLIVDTRNILDAELRNHAAGSIVRL
jgi:UDP-N-acetyl-D-glucosamine dehydrogenase